MSTHHLYDTINNDANNIFDLAMGLKKTDPGKSMGQFEEAVKMYKEVFELRMEKIPESARVANPVYNWANCYKEMYDISKDSKYLVEAEKSYREAIEIRTKAGDIDSIALSQKKGNLGIVLSLQDKHEEALVLLKDSMLKHIESCDSSYDSTKEAIEMYESAFIKSGGDEKDFQDFIEELL